MFESDFYVDYYLPKKMYLIKNTQGVTEKRRFIDMAFFRLFLTTYPVDCTWQRVLF